MVFIESVKAILNETWPTILLVSVIILSMRTIYILKNKVKFVLYKDFMYYFFIIYILCLFYVVTFQDVSWSTSNITPFKEILRYSFGSRMFLKNVIGNAVMFIPFGFFASYFLKLEKARSITLLTLLTSATIELTQLAIGRVYDIDDILLNLIGGLIGFILYKLVHKIRLNLPDSLKKDYIYNIILVFFLLILLIIVKLVML